MDGKNVWIIIVCRILLIPVATLTPLSYKPASASTIVPLLEQIFTCSSITPQREKLEAQFTNYFGDDHWYGNIKEGRTTYWESVIMLDRFGIQFMQEVCQEALDVNPHPLLPESSTNLNYKWVHDVFLSELIIGPDKKRMQVVVLECEKNGVGIFHLIKGRRPTSVYFVKPFEARDRTKPLHDVILDENFDSDIDLRTDLQEKTYYVMTERSKRVNELEEERSKKKKKYGRDL